MFQFKLYANTIVLGEILIRHHIPWNTWNTYITLVPLSSEVVRFKEATERDVSSRESLSNRAINCTVVIN